MPDESRILELLEEALDSRRTPEEVCADSPELLWEVKERWERCQNVEAQIEQMFPTTGTGKNFKRCLHLPTTLPLIPGYQIDTVLGRGGMGIVYKARHLKLNRSVAIKMLVCPELAASDELTSLLREAQAVAGLTHANIVQVHDVGDLDGLPYFTMEFIEGGSLAQKLNGVPQPAREAASMMVLLARAVHAAHEGGVVHRDLKPSNILLRSDGTPKITDFGLARRLEAGAAVSMKAARVGTPSYMAPEQALGKVGAFCPSVDIYSLGAILYEMLTGRPPFKAETASETQRQLIAEEPVPPSRLNAKVPRDLQTISLKCLRKDATRRYSTAAELADDLGRFLRGEPVTARPISLLERGFKWARRHPTVAAMLATGVVAAIGAAVIFQRFSVQQAGRRQELETDLKEMLDLQHRAMWTDARIVLARAEARLEGLSARDLRARVSQAGKDLNLVMKLDSIRLSRFTNGELPFYKAQTSRRYAMAFADAGLGTIADDAKIAAARIRNSSVRGELVAALDDWAVCAMADDERRWLLEVTRLADADPTGWRERIRDAQSWSDAKALAELAASVPVASQPVPLLLALGERIRAAGGDAPAFFKRVQKEHPADFWANLILGDVLLRTAPVDAGGYYRAALASRPGAAVGYTSVGDALNSQNLTDEAMAYYQKAVAIDPTYARGHTNLGNMHKRMARIQEAIACYRKALEVDPNYAWAHFDLGSTLDGAGRLEEAMEHYRQFHEVDPDNLYITNILRADMVRQGRGEEALAEWQRQLQADPSEHDAYFGYAEMCLFLGKMEQYREAREHLLRRFGQSSDANLCEKVSRACLLAEGTEQETRMAAALAQRAVDARASTPQWLYSYYQFAHGLAEYRQGNFDSAISIMRGQAGSVMGPAPGLVMAMAQYKKGEMADARKTLAAAIAHFDWSPRHADRRDHFIMHILRREAEAMIIPNVQAFLEGRYGIGDDAGQLTEVERAQWRRQWLEEELAALEKTMEGASEVVRGRMQPTLAQWQATPDLAPIRDSAGLEKLPVGERQEWISLWARVDSLLQRIQQPANH